MLRHRSLSLFLIGCLLTPLAIAQSDPIQRLLDEGNATAAYQLARQRLPQEEGEPAFDLLYGLAAVEVGEYGEAIFAFERVLIAYPNHDRSRLELARAYFNVGNLEAAEDQFRTVLSHNPPVNVRTRVEGYLERIATYQSARQSQLSGAFEMTIGSDTNINAATSLSTVDVPALGVVSLDPTGRATRDRYKELALSGEYRRALDKESLVFASASVRDRNNFGSETFDTRAFGLTLGYSLKRGQDSLRFPLQVQQLYLDSQRYRRVTSIGADWSRPLGKKDSLSLFGQLGAIRYFEQDSRDVDLKLLGGVWSRRLAWKQATTSLSAYLGDEDAMNIGGSHNGRRFAGLRAGLQWQPAEKQTVYTVLGHQWIKHADVDPVFSVKRRDRLAQLLVGWDFQLDRRLTLKLKADLSDNGSNIELNKYRRRQLSFTLHAGF